MILTISITLVIILTIALAVVYRQKREAERELVRVEKERNEEAELLRVCQVEAENEEGALAQFNQQRQEIIEERKGRILSKLENQKHI